ncbi:hypothetical protein KAX35_05795, partial [candidate division WOR-3 bacterium]|nr:hypothetical protein [candidate division WOR-3 bacterium]
DNRYRRQFIWSPYQLANQTPVSRSAPPLKGSMTYPNCDGFSFPDGTFTYWRGVGILPTGSGNDYDLRLHNDYTGSTQGFGTYLESSGSWGTQSDFVLVNENSTASSGTYYAGVNRYSGGTSNFRIQRADDGTTIHAPDTTGTFTIHSYDIIDVHEIEIGQTGLYRFTLDNISGTADLGISLYDAHQPYFGKWDYMTGAYSNSNTGGQDESFMIEITTTGWYGFVVWKSDHTDLGKSNTYKIMIETKEEGAWEGDVSSNWHTAGNWFGGSVPNSSMDVFIPSGTPYSPVISTNHANCLDLTVNAGATLTLTNKTLYANGDVQFSGTINATGTGFYIRARGNWLDYGNFNPGTGYYVVIDGSIIQYIING